MIKWPSIHVVHFNITLSEFYSHGVSQPTNATSQDRPKSPVAAPRGGGGGGKGKARGKRGKGGKAKPEPPEETDPRKLELLNWVCDWKHLTKYIETSEYSDEQETGSHFNQIYYFDKSQCIFHSKSVHLKFWTKSTQRWC